MKKTNITEFRPLRTLQQLLAFERQNTVYIKR